MVEHVDKQDGVDARVVMGQMGSVERLHSNVLDGANQYLHGGYLEIGSPVVELLRNETVARPDVHDGRAARQEIREVRTQDVGSSWVHVPGVHWTEERHSRFKPRMLMKKLARIVCEPSASRVVAGMMRRIHDA